MSNVPSLSFTPTGLVAPTEAQILAGRQADIDAAFGGGVNPGLTTAQGQLATTETAIIADKNDQMLAIVNGIDPAYAAGRMQDAIGRIYFLDRNPALATTVPCVCIGAQSTIIPSGALVSDGVNLWACVQGGTIPVGGSLTLTFACTVTGPTPCPANTVNRIFQTIPGWDSVNNPSQGVIGALVESRADFEHRRQQSVEQNAVGVIQALVGKVLNVPGVIDAYGYQNDTAGPITVGGVTIPANAVYVCVSGGDPQVVANTLWLKKMPGAPWFGNTTETVLDTSNGYTPPYPSYSVSFQTAAALPILFSVNLTNSALVPANAAALVQAAVISAFTGGDGGGRARIGSAIYASRFYAGVAALGPWAQVVDIKIGTSSATLDNLTVPIDHIPTIVATNIAVNLI